MSKLTTAQQELVAKYLPLAYRLAKEEKQSRGGDIDDLRQEAALAMVKCVPSYDAIRGTFATLVITSVKNHFDKLATKKRIVMQPLTFDPPQTEPAAPVEDDRLERLRIAVASLPRSERQAMLLIMSGLTGPQAGLAMNVTRVRINQLVQKALARIIKRLGLQFRRPSVSIRRHK